MFRYRWLMIVAALALVIPQIGCGRTRSNYCCPSTSSAAPCCPNPGGAMPAPAGAFQPGQ